MKAEKLLEKLESYETRAYEDEMLGGSAWLERVGHEFTSYVRDCKETKSSVTISGFFRRIEDMAEKLDLVDDGQQ